MITCMCRVSESASICCPCGLCQTFCHNTIGIIPHTAGTAKFMEAMKEKHDANLIGQVCSLSQPLIRIKTRAGRILLEAPDSLAWASIPPS